jgi:hypothetical protein
MTTNPTRNPSLRHFMDQYEIEEHEVAHVAKVPRMTVWRVVHGQPVSAVHAAAIRQALWQLSGEVYRGTLPTGAEVPLDLQTSREQRGGSAQ